MNANSDKLRATAFQAVELSRQADALLIDLCQRAGGEPEELLGVRAAAFDHVRRAGKCLDAAAMEIFFALAKRMEPTE